MKKIYILVIILFSLNSYSQNCNIGNDTITNDFMTAGSFGANNLLGVKYTLSQVGTLQSINLVGNGTGEGVQMAVYDDNAGVPNNLVASSSLDTVQNGITSLPVTPTLLPAGDYWIMAVYEIGGNSSNKNQNATGNSVYYQSLTYGDPIPTNASGFLRYTGRDFLYFLEIDCGNTLSIEDFDLNSNILLFPNPSTDYIQINGLTSSENYKIYNALGKEIQKGFVVENEKINVENLSNGLYFLKLENGNTIKFIKE
jgi:hypothetical protein